MTRQLRSTAAASNAIRRAADAAEASHAAHSLDRALWGVLKPRPDQRLRATHESGAPGGLPASAHPFAAPALPNRLLLATCLPGQALPQFELSEHCHPDHPPRTNDESRRRRPERRPPSSRPFLPHGSYSSHPSHSSHSPSPAPPRVPGPRPGQRGAALIIAIAILVILLAIGLTFYAVSQMQFNASTNLRNAVRAELTAEAGTAIAVGFLNHDLAVHPTVTSTDFAPSTYFNGACFIGKPLGLGPAFGEGFPIQFDPTTFPTIAFDDVDDDGDGWVDEGPAMGGDRPQPLSNPLKKPSFCSLAKTPKTGCTYRATTMSAARPRHMWPPTATCLPGPSSLTS